MTLVPLDAKNLTDASATQPPRRGPVPGVELGGWIVGKSAAGDGWRSLLIKPFDTIEVKQLAVGLSEKWRLKQQSKLRVHNLEKLGQGLAVPLSRDSRRG
jgi:hypothetical protein